MESFDDTADQMVGLEELGLVLERDLVGRTDLVEKLAAATFSGKAELGLRAPAADRRKLYTEGTRDADLVTISAPEGLNRMESISRKLRKAGQSIGDLGRETGPNLEEHHATRQVEVGE